MTQQVEVDVSVDRLILYVGHVNVERFQKFYDFMEYGERNGYIDKLIVYHSNDIKGYHYNLKIGEGAGAIHIGYKHNSANEREDGYNLRMECNPSKQTKNDRWFLKIFTSAFLNYEKRIKGVDIAFDISTNISNVFPISLTGRDMNIYRGTRYFGGRGEHGFMRIYDKKKELKDKQGIEIDEEKTRVEFVARFGDGITLQEFSHVELEIDKLYKVAVCDLDKVEGVVKACVIAVSSGQMDIKELSRTYRKKTKNALDSMRLLGLDDAFLSARDSIVEVIKKYTVFT